jgi:hypothetical protein
MQNFLILGMLISAPDFQAAGEEALKKLRSCKTFKPRLGRSSFSRSLAEVDVVPVENLTTGEMDCVQFPRFAF